MKIIKFFGDENLSLKNLKHSSEITIDFTDIKTNRVVLAKQIHSNKLKLVTEKHAGAGISKRAIIFADGLITYQKNLFLGIKTADCIPILIWDRRKEIIAAVHSGRKGVELKIAEKTVKLLHAKYGCNYKDIELELGPSICSKCYSVDQKTFNKFVHSTKLDQNFPYLDLKKVVLHNLKQTGIPEENIKVHDVCTKEDKNFFSYRKNNTKQRQISLIGMI